MLIKGFFRALFPWLVCLCAILVITGCGQGEPTTVTVAGSIDLAGSQPLPEHATARISMFEHRDGGGDKRIVAERTLHDLGDKSIAFTVDIERNLINPEGDYGVRGEILSQDGTILWQSKNAKKVKPLENKSEIHLELVPNATDADLTFEQFRCEDGFHLAAAIQGERAVVRLGNRRLVMLATKREGAFKGEHGNELVKNADMIEVQIDGSTHASCAVVANQSPPAANEASTDVPEQQAGTATRGNGGEKNTTGDQPEPDEGKDR
jgi:uncharacterized lipoprotein YbaY